MNIDDLTIGQAREIAAILGSDAPEKKSLLERHIGKVVVVRSNLSGVWLGRVESVNGRGLALTGARRAHYWKGALDCCSLAGKGPSPESRMSAPRPVVTVLEACEVLDAGPEAIARWAAVPEWTQS